MKTKISKFGTGKNDAAYILTVRKKGEKVLFGIVFVLFALYAVSFILPFLFLIINSLKDGLEYINDVSAATTFHTPDVWRFKNYLLAFTDMKFVDSVGRAVYLPEMFFNSLWYCLLFTFSGIAASSLTAYVISKYKFRSRLFFYGIAVFSMTIPVIGTTAAMYKLTYGMGIYNTPLFPFLTNFAGFGFNFLILYGFFSNLSWSYAEAVFIDGGGHFTVFTKIMLPQALPCIVTLFITSFITCWNDYQTLLLYMPDYPTLASGIYKIQLSIKRDGTKYPEYFAGLVIAVLPILVLFSVFSDTIMSNFTVGGLKG